MRSNTCSKVMISYPTGDSILLNTFLIVSLCKNDFTVTPYEEIIIARRKNAKNIAQKVYFFVFFRRNNYDFLMKSDRKNHFGTIILLETLRNIELPLGYDIMTLEHVFGRILVKNA